MALINWLGGNACGKMDGLIFQKWKDKTIVRSYFKPSNPRTEKQQAHRNLFSSSTKIASQFYNVIYKGYYPEAKPAEIYRRMLSEISQFKDWEEYYSSLEECVFQEYLVPYNDASNIGEYFINLERRNPSLKSDVTFCLQTENDISPNYNFINIIYYDIWEDRFILYKKPFERTGTGDVYNNLYEISITMPEDSQAISEIQYQFIMQNNTKFSINYTGNV